VDVYRRQIRSERNLIDLGTYISMFPQLIAGPIVIYSDIIRAIKNTAKRVSLNWFSEGVEIFTIGLGSKVLFANRFGQVWESMAQMGYENMSAGTAWLGALAYTFQIYFDFNGYSLMAIGLGKMLGFRIPRNFNTPYAADSVTSFWKRWHMTLTSFFRTYLYIPLGGNRKGRFRTCVNMFIVWCATGFWHGADWNFIIWGLYYFVFLAIERFVFSKKEGVLAGRLAVLRTKLAGQRYAGVIKPVCLVLRHGYTLAVVIVGWVIFAVTDMGELSQYIGRLFSPLSGNGAGMSLTTFSGVMYVWFVLGAVFSVGFMTGLFKKLKDGVFKSLILLFIFWASVVQLSDGVYNPFLYFRF
jgi:alginate O-acetyltransferase complex protein AlgI